MYVVNHNAVYLTIEIEFMVYLFNIYTFFFFFVGFFEVMKSVFSISGPFLVSRNSIVYNKKTY